jgi:hypothetical protein
MRQLREGKSVLLLAAPLAKCVAVAEMHRRTSLQIRQAEVAAALCADGGALCRRANGLFHASQDVANVTFCEHLKEQKFSDYSLTEGESPVSQQACQSRARDGREERVSSQAPKT